MSAAAWTYQLDFTFAGATPRVIRMLAYCAAQIAGAATDMCHDVSIAVHEALSNAHLYGYAEEAEAINMDVAFRNGTLTFLIRNHGARVRDFVVPTVRPEGSGETLGLFLMGQLMGEVAVVRNHEGEGVAVRLSKRVT